MKALNISQNLFMRYENTQMVQHYYGLLALYGLAQTAVESKSSRLLKKCIDLLALYPDKVVHPSYNFENYRAGGNGKAWLVMMESMGKLEAGTGFSDEQKEIVREYAEKTLQAPKDRNGILCMPGRPELEQIWIDVVTAVTPYMLFAGLAFDEDRYIDFAAEQCFKMYEIFLDPDCGLLHQCRGFMEDKEAFSEDHWSRGNGWGYLGLAELVQYLPDDSPHRAKAKQYFKELSAAMLRYQGPNGLWRQEMTVDTCWEESSGTGLILYGYGIGLRLGLLDRETYYGAFERGIKGLSDLCINEDFSTENSCPGCLCPGNGKNKGTIYAYIHDKQPIRDEPHSYGCFMLAMVEAHRNGIEDIIR